MSTEALKSYYRRKIYAVAGILNNDPVRFDPEAIRSAREYALQVAQMGVGDLTLTEAAERGMDADDRRGYKESLGDIDLSQYRRPRLPAPRRP